MRLEVHAILERYWDGELPVDVETIAKHLGVVLRETSDPSISGEFRYEEGVPTVWYKGTDPSPRQRFTIAHELGHYCLGHPGGFRDNLANLFNPDLRQDVFERQANRFAAQLLMPKGSVLQVITQTSGLKELADRFLVSEQAMHFRLKNLGIVS